MQRAVTSRGERVRMHCRSCGSQGLRGILHPCDTFQSYVQSKGKICSQVTIHRGRLRGQPHPCDIVQSYGQSKFKICLSMAIQSQLSLKWPPFNSKATGRWPFIKVDSEGNFIPTPFNLMYSQSVKYVCPWLVSHNCH